MSDGIKLFLNGIANSLNTNGYYHIVTPPKKMGVTTKKINAERSKIHKIKERKINERLAEITT
ncbi:MAG: hypothetical protein LGB54_01360 [Sulfurovum sp.]|nr:hypothetical protein [Sulfurovum sp.]MCB4747233.1 hypothetical protein [Sulfurovum sp.]MCB4749155.1 hypothetical protein [Sulfurovum sp.]MCB4749971.1 hypothetical protein [Sulfurovum sp.]MCB4751779.1 hypothetical protein [Sulfurovum sp.]